MSQAREQAEKEPQQKTLADCKLTR